MRSVMAEIASSRTLDLSVVVGGSLVLEKYGQILDSEITRMPKVDHQLHFVIEGENPLTMAKSAGLAVIEISSVLQNVSPDIVCVIADRFECLPIAMAAAYMNIAVAHFEGGEVSGSIDESIRHAITKLAHIHFPANEDAKQRIIRMGEVSNSVFCVGSTSIDILKSLSLGNLGPAKLYLESHGVGASVNLVSGEYIVVIQHPVTTEYESSYDDVKKLVSAVQNLNKKTVWIWPNMDAGSDSVSKAIREYRELQAPKHVRFLKSLPIEIFGPLLSNAGCILGNSSSGIREAAYLGTPTVNIGTRQNGRGRSQNVQDVEVDEVQIIEAVKEQMQHGKYKSDYSYGDGESASKIVSILETFELHAQKKNSY